jgi:predicted aspartyl protease
MGLGKVIGWGIALGLIALILVAGIIGAVKHASEVTAGTGLAVLILLGALSYIAEKFNKALREYRTLRATKPGKPLQ